MNQVAESGWHRRHPRFASAPWDWGTFGPVVATMLIGAGGVLFGLATIWNYAAGAALLGLISLSILFFVTREKGPRLFLALQAALLIGYAFLDRGFAYLGVAPIFIGEIVLVVGVVSVLATGRFLTVLRSPLACTLVAFCVWGAVCTIPHIPTEKAYALRDAAIWGYGVFALLVASAILSTGSQAAELLRSACRIFDRMLPVLVVFLPIAIIVGAFAGSKIPDLPGTEVPIMRVKPGAASVHLAGVAAFLLLGLREASRKRGSRVSQFREWGVWFAWFAGFVTAAAFSRGGTLSVIAVFVLLSPTIPIVRWFRIGAIGIVLVGGLLLSDFEIDAGRSREISAEQLRRNVMSVFGGGKGDLHNTREWRLSWWTDIVNYTVFGEYFWFGRGYGANLGDTDGYQVFDGSLRSPHNASMTILARSGVPGAALWVILQVAFVVAMTRAFFRARARGQRWWASMNLWVLAYWLACQVNGAFDVFLEGPQGGIWFWTLIGLGIALLEVQRTLPFETPGPRRVAA